MHGLTTDVVNAIKDERPRAILPIRIEPEGMGFVFVDGEMRHLNAVSSFIFRHLDGKTSIGDLVAIMSAEFPGVPAEELLEDVVKSVRNFQMGKMVRWSTRGE
jgi:hypothetical protein